MKILPPTIEQLRAQGFKIEIHHWRYNDTGELTLVNRQPDEEGNKRSRENLATKGGETQVKLLTPEGREIIATASCHTEKENFNYSRGVRIALGRAWAQHLGVERRSS